MKRVIFHIDMNNFYASVECVFNPCLKNYAVAVAGDPNKRTGIILAKNYIAKSYGVKTGEAIWEAKQKCPTLITVAPHYDIYLEYSRRAREIYSKYTDIIEPFGIDECWLDVTSSLKYFNCTALELAKTIQDDVFNTLHLTVSIGISWGKTLAKLGSDMKKPMGLTIIDDDNYLNIIKRLKIDDMIMIGKHTAKKLRDMNINTLYDLYSQNPNYLKQHFGVIGQYLHNAVCGIDDDKLITPRDEDTKSVGNGATATHDMKSMEEIRDFMHDLADKVSSRLRAHAFAAKTIHLTIKYADFTYASAQHTLLRPFNSAQDVYKFACEIFYELAGEKFAPVRAIRICTSNLILENKERQIDIFSNTKDERLCKALDELKLKYGENIINLAKNYKNI